ncbi:unnamed protein product [Enterobius vermicularis]|uniref:Phosphorylase b kinase regulatory subunit n=1 Tax=Enterobius vermicularis TaxID=51028 RepID=A0A0N4VNW7_ENTVE|nr:unnamed protein product [Enterobius vermicularis]
MDLKVSYLGRLDDSSIPDRTRQFSSRVQSSQAYSHHLGMLDDSSIPYGSIPSSPVTASDIAFSLVPTAATSTIEESDLSCLVSDRTCFYKKLQRLSMSGINIPAPAVLQDRTKPSDHKYNQKEVYLMTLKNEKHRKGDLLWLAFRAALAGSSIEFLTLVMHVIYESVVWDLEYFHSILARAQNTMFRLYDGLELVVKYEARRLVQTQKLCLTVFTKQSLLDFFRSRSRPEGTILNFDSLG